MDVEQLDRARIDVMEHVARIRLHQAEISRATLATARHLACIQAAVDADKFPAIVAKQFGWSPAAAAQLIALCDHFGADERVEHIQAGALLLLAAPDVPVSVRREARNRARAGFVNGSMVRGMLEAHAAGKDLATSNGMASTNGHAGSRRSAAPSTNGQAERNGQAHAHRNGRPVAPPRSELAIAELEFANQAIGLRIVNALEEKLGILTVEQLLAKRREDILTLPNFGMKAVELLAESMASAGFGSWSNELLGKHTYST